MSRTGPPPHHRSDNLPPTSTKGHNLFLAAAQAVVPRPYRNLNRSTYRLDSHSYHLFVEEFCQAISIHEVLSTSISNWNSTLSHLYYGILLMYRLIVAKIDADQATDDERHFVRVFEARLGVDHIIPQPLIPYFAHLGAVRLTEAYGTISPRGPEFSENTNRAINLDQRGICKIAFLPLIAFFLRSLARDNPDCSYNVDDRDSPNYGYPQANFQFAGLRSNDPNHYSRIVSTAGFYPMFTHKSTDLSDTRRFLRKFNEAEIRGNVNSPYDSLVNWIPLDFRNENSSFDFLKSLTSMHREIGKFSKDSISLSAIAAHGTRTSLVETYTLNECALDDVEYSLVEERLDDDEPVAGPSTAAPTATRATKSRGRGKKATTARTRSADTHVTYHQPNSTQLDRSGIKPLDPGFKYRIFYKLTDQHEISTGSGLSFILTGPNLHASLQADLYGPYFADVNEDHDNNVVPNPLRYQLYKLNAEHPAFNAKHRVSTMLRRALPTINHEDLDKVPTLKTLETANP